MAVMTFTQFCLTTLILGVVIFDFKFGSSPFLLLRDVVQDAVFVVNPEYVPEDGNGLNPLLQLLDGNSYYFVLRVCEHGGSFCYAVAGMWMANLEWINQSSMGTICSHDFGYWYAHGRLLGL